MKAAVEIINPYDKKKLTALFKMKFLKVIQMGADLGIGQNVGLGFYKVVTFFLTKYKNQHQFILLEGVDTEENKVYLHTELCSTDSGSASSSGRSGYFLYYSRDRDELLRATNQKNPVINYSFDICVTGEQVYEGVTREKEKYKIIGNNCQDYADRFIQFILSKSEENLNNDSNELHLSEFIQIKNKKKMKNALKNRQNAKIDDSSLSQNSNLSNIEQISLISSSSSESDSVSKSKIYNKLKIKTQLVKKIKENKVCSNENQTSILNKKNMMNTVSTFKSSIKNTNNNNHMARQKSCNNEKIIENSLLKNRNKEKFFNLNSKIQNENNLSERKGNQFERFNQTTEKFKFNNTARPRIHTTELGNNFRNHIIENKVIDNGFVIKKNFQEFSTIIPNMNKNKILLPNLDKLKKDSQRKPGSDLNTEKVIKKNVPDSFNLLKITLKSNPTNELIKDIINNINHENPKEVSDLKVNKNQEKQFEKNLNISGSNYIEENKIVSPISTKTLEIPLNNLNKNIDYNQDNNRCIDLNPNNFNKKIDYPLENSISNAKNNDSLGISFRENKLFLMRTETPVTISFNKISKDFYNDSQFRKSIDVGISKIKIQKIPNEINTNAKLEKSINTTEMIKSDEQTIVKQDNFFNNLDDKNMTSRNSALISASPSLPLLNKSILSLEKINIPKKNELETKIYIIKKEETNLASKLWSNEIRKSSSYMELITNKL